MIGARDNGGQEFGEVKAGVEALTESFKDFRDESREFRREFREDIQRLSDGVNKRFENAEADIGSLKKWRWYITGAGFGAGALASFVARLLKS